MWVLILFYLVITIIGIGLSKRFLYFYTNYDTNSKDQWFLDEIIKKYRIFFWTSFIPFVNLITVGWIVWTLRQDNWRVFNLHPAQKKWVWDASKTFYKGLGLGVSIHYYWENVREHLAHPNDTFVVVLSIIVPFYGFEVNLNWRYRR